MAYVILVVLIYMLIYHRCNIQELEKNLMELLKDLLPIMTSYAL